MSLQVLLSRAGPWNKRTLAQVGGRSWPGPASAGGCRGEWPVFPDGKGTPRGARTPRWAGAGWLWMGGAREVGWLRRGRAWGGPGLRGEVSCGVWEQGSQKEGCLGCGRELGLVLLTLHGARTRPELPGREGPGHGADRGPGRDPGRDPVRDPERENPNEKRGGNPGVVSALTRAAVAPSGTCCC